MIPIGSSNYLYFSNLPKPALVTGFDSSLRVQATQSTNFSSGTQLVPLNALGSNGTLIQNGTPIIFQTQISGVNYYITKDSNNNELHLKYELPFTDPNDFERQVWIVQTVDPTTLNIQSGNQVVSDQTPFILLNYGSQQSGVNRYASFDQFTTGGNLLITQDYASVPSTQRSNFILSLIQVESSSVLCCFSTQSGTPANQLCPTPDSSTCQSFIQNSYCVGNNLSGPNCIKYAQQFVGSLNSNYTSFCSDPTVAAANLSVCPCFVPPSTVPLLAVAEANGIGISRSCVAACSFAQVKNSTETCSGTICIENVTVGGVTYTQEQIEAGALSGLTINFSENCGAPSPTPGPTPGPNPKPNPGFFAKYWWIFLIGFIILLIIIILIIVLIK